MSRVPELSELKALDPIPQLRGEALIRHADMIAQIAHRNARYGAEPYFWHPFEGAMLAENLGYGPETIASLLQHDVVEDTELEIDDLARLGQPPSVLAGVEGVTFIDAKDNPGGLQGIERQALKIAKAKSNPMSKVTKTLDSGRNFATAVTSSWRPGSMRDTRTRMLEYAGNLAVLTEGLPTPAEIAEYVEEMDAATRPVETTRFDGFGDDNTKMRQVEWQKREVKMQEFRVRQARQEVRRLIRLDRKPEE